MKIAIITTVNHNVGDDFVREGLMYLMRQRFNNKDIQFLQIHKHSPITVRDGFEFIRNRYVSDVLDSILPLGIGKDKILEADLVIQSGAPVYWCHSDDNNHCSKNEWYKPLIKRRFLKNKKAKLANLAAGTCQKYHSDGKEFLNCTPDLDYMKEFYNLSSVTTVRDTLAKNIFKLMNIDVPVIPCSSIFAIDEHGLKRQAAEYVVINYMEGGAHYTFGQNIDKEKWRKEFTKFYNKIKTQENVVFACHNEKEVKEAKAIDPSAKIFFSTDFLEYMKFYSKAKFGIVNRVHSAFLMGSYGIPGTIIGNDTRARMGYEIGLESAFVNDADFDYLMSKYELLKTQGENYQEKFKLIKAKAYQDYMKAFEGL
jgi:hypothetical protein